MFIRRDPFFIPFNYRPAPARALPWVLLGFACALLAMAAGCARPTPTACAVDAGRMASEIEQALGGRRALSEIRFLRFDYVVMRNGREVERRSHLWDRRTGRYRLEGHDNGIPYVNLFNVKTRKGQSFSGLQPQPMADSGPALARAYEAFQHDTDWLLGGLRLHDRDVALHDAGTQMIPATPTSSGTRAVPTLLAEFPRGPAGQVVRYRFYLDPTSRRPYAWAVSEPGQSGPPVIYQWTAWQNVDRLNLPVRFVRQGGDAWTITIDRLYAPRDVPRELFEAVVAPIHEKIRIQPNAPAKPTR